ncbi:MAG: glyoxalase [Planctomycetaceae bacterium]|nr:glyoxalase [Planctomycetaceae bacterium]
MGQPPFHIAFAVTDLAQARAFYGELLGCAEGRSAPRWVDFDLFGHQLSAHLVDGGLDAVATNEVDGDGVPVRHFGLILPWDDWHALAARLGARGTAFLIAPRIRFEGQVGEQATFFLLDPSGNALEFKSFRDPARVFAREL